MYSEICKLENILAVTSEVCRNTNNKRKINKFKEFKCVYVSRIYNDLINKRYVVGPYNNFKIYEPKERNIVSQGIYDKIVNHLVARFILMPVIMPRLVEQNVSSQKGKGVKKGLDCHFKYLNLCKQKYKEFYILKCDVSKFFASINHDILKEKLKKVIKDEDALKIVFDIIDSVENGLGIGNMTSQILSIFYLNDLDHFIKEELKIKYYVRYQDDWCLYHKSKEYLKYCLIQIESFLKKEKMLLNNKTRIYKSTNNFIFLGRDTNGRYAKYRYMNRRKNKKYKQYISKRIGLNNYISTIISYKNLEKKYRLKY